jgi:hypothetical protein
MNSIVVFIDVDGTILDENYNFKALDAIERLKQKKSC